MALRPRVRKHAPAVKRGHAISSPRKIKALKAFTNWVRALDTNPAADLTQYASAQGVRAATVWRYVRSDPKIAERFVHEIMGNAQQGLAMAVARWLQVLQTNATFHNDEESGITVDEDDVALMREQRAWFDTFAKYVHGAYKRDEKGEGGTTVNVNVGVPAHVRARMGLDDVEVQKIDHVLKKTEGLIDGL